MHLDRGAGQLDFRLGQRQRIAQINFVNALRADRVRSPDFDLPVNAPRAQDGGINQVGAIGSQNDHHVLQRLQSIHLRAKHRHQRAGHRVVTSAMARAEDRLRLVDEQKSQRAIVGPLAALGEQVAHLALGFTHPHVQDFGAFDVQEKFGAIHAGLGFDLLPKIVRRGLAEQRFAATGRAVQQKTFRHRVLEPFEQVAMDKRQFDRVADGLHRLLLAADVRPGQLGHRLQGTFDALAHADDFEGDALVHVQADVHARLQLFFAEQRRTLQHQRHQAGFLADAQAAVRKQIIHANNRPIAVEAQSQHDGKSFVQEDALADLQTRQRNLRVYAANVIGAGDTDVALVRLNGHQKSPDAEGGRPKFLDDSVHLLDGLPRRYTMSRMAGWRGGNLLTIRSINCNVESLSNSSRGSRPPSAGKTSGTSAGDLLAGDGGTDFFFGSAMP